MFSLEELQKELNQARSQLDAITIKKYTGVKYDYEKGETYGEETSYNEYTDPAMAKQLISIIRTLENRIGSYAQDAKDRADLAREYQKDAKEKRDILVRNKALEIYNKDLEVYNKKNIFQKAGMLFSGKRPKKNMSQKEVMQKYGAEADYTLAEPGITSKIAELEEIKQENINWYMNQTDMTEQQKRDSIEITTRHYDEEIAKLQATLSAKREGMKM